jgi:hypothetical protein
LAGQALACPTSEDVLGDGVRITFDDGRYSVITRDASGAVVETERDNGATYVYEADGGLLETGYVEDGVRDVFTYDFDTSDILPLRPWSRDAGVQIALNESGEEIERVGFSYHTLGESTYDIGDCSYAAIRVLTYYAFEDGQTMIELTYLIELGIPINTAYGYDGTVDVYRATAIAAE